MASRADQATAQEFIKKLLQERATLDTSARGSTITFVQREIGDVLIAWENEALLAMKAPGTARSQWPVVVTKRRSGRKSRNGSAGADSTISRAASSPTIGASVTPLCITAK